ncbi:MAG TPA: PEP-CTERM sorting domain-containing protein [Gammaproteobacteria bacterium]|nr:PEP-CTERM sorting domain-containing protein [Gammaproteobacteria bacterium]
MRLLTQTLTAVIASAVLAANAYAGLITFENLSGDPVGTVVNSQYAGTDGVTFSSDPVLGDVGGAAEGWYNGSQADSFVPGGSNNNGSYFITDTQGLKQVPAGGAATANLTVDYSSPVDALSFDLIDIDFGESYTISVYDAANNLLDSKTVQAGDPGTGNGVATTIGLSVPNISKLQIDGIRTQSGGFGLAFDNFNTSVDTTQTRSVPEPATPALMGLGIVGLFLARRRRPTPA